MVFIKSSFLLAAAAANSCLNGDSGEFEAMFSVNQKVVQDEIENADRVKFQRFQHTQKSLIRYENEGDEKCLVWKQEDDYISVLLVSMDECNKTDDDHKNWWWNPRNEIHPVSTENDDPADPDLDEEPHHNEMAKLCIKVHQDEKTEEMYAVLSDPDVDGCSGYEAAATDSSKEEDFGLFCEFTQDRRSLSAVHV